MIEVNELNDFTTELSKNGVTIGYIHKPASSWMAGYDVSHNIAKYKPRMGYYRKMCEALHHFERIENRIPKLSMYHATDNGVTIVLVRGEIVAHIFDEGDYFKVVTGLFKGDKQYFLSKEIAIQFLRREYADLID